MVFSSSLSPKKMLPVRQIQTVNSYRRENSKTRTAARKHRSLGHCPVWRSLWIFPLEVRDLKSKIHFADNNLAFLFIIQGHLSRNHRSTCTEGWAACSPASAAYTCPRGSLTAVQGKRRSGSHGPSIGFNRLRRRRCLPEMPQKLPYKLFYSH